MNKKTFLVLILFCIPTFLKAEGQEGLVIIADFFYFLFTIILWTFLYLITLFLIKKIRNKENSISLKYSIGISYLLLSLYHFSMIKSDSRPFQGPMDEFINRNEIKRFKEEDALRGLNEQLDSVLEICDGSIIPDEVGVYVWLDGKKKFVREINTEINGDKDNDSLTWRIIKSWKK